MAITCCLNDNSEFRLERGTTNKESVDIGLIDQVSAVGSIRRSTVNDSSGSGCLSRNVFSQPRTDVDVSVLSNSGGSGLSGTDGPDRLVSDNN